MCVVCYAQVSSGLRPSVSVVSAFLRGYYEKGEYDEAWRHMDSLRTLANSVSGSGGGGPSRGGKGPSTPLGLSMGANGLQDLMGVCVRREDWTVRGSTGRRAGGE